MITAGLIALFAIAGCAQPYHMKTKFEPGSTDWAKGDGTATIEGQGFMMTMGGTPRTCAGRRVTLTPATAYTIELTSASLKPFVSTIVHDPNEVIPTRATTCNVRGEFTFRNLPAGNWIVLTSALWVAGVGRYSSVEGGLIFEFVTTKENKTSEVLVTQ